MRQPANAAIHDSTTLADGLKCSGGIVYRTSMLDGIKTITVLMDTGKAVRCK